MATDAVTRDERPLVMHVVYRFDTGGLENGIVNLINHMPASAYRHVVVALTEVTAFKQRIRNPEVEFVSLHKPAGHSVWLYPRLFMLMRRLRPAIVHTRNLAALEVAVPAWLAGVPVRLHGEHGRDIGDLDGSNRKYQWLRRLYRPFVTHYVALSNELADYLGDRIGVEGERVTQIINGVDLSLFTAATSTTAALTKSIPGCPFNPAQHWIIGSVGRMHPVKDQPALVRALSCLVALRPALRDSVRLVLVGDGPLRAHCQALLEGAGIADLAWLPGERDDIHQIMRGLHCYASPSLAEGISNTILEAMATGLPVVATHVGGNADLVVHGKTGLLVPSASPDAMAEALAKLAAMPDRGAGMGRAGRARVEARFSLQGMVETYHALYDHHVARARPRLQGG